MSVFTLLKTIEDICGVWWLLVNFPVLQVFVNFCVFRCLVISAGTAVYLAMLVGGW